jgi:acyl-CoA synthetase (AMP-forming)/AMP-acid ligase II
VLALIEEATGATWTHAELRRDVELTAVRLSAARSLVFVRCRIDAATVLNYLGARAAGHAVVLVDDRMKPELLADLERRYEPRLVLHPDGAVEERADAPEHELHPDLALMLTTSGTTGSPKLVRLSARNLEANARSIATYLELGPEERAIASLPFHYSYGLSVLNSHLLAGGGVVLPADGLVSRGFWDAFERHECTSFAGVPYTYSIIERTGWRRRALPTLRTMTQAGGRLDVDAQLSLHGELRSRDARLVIMYGQTEATARIAYVPPERLSEKAGSIGVPIPGGELWVEDDELVYRGPNVMLGYATEPAHLALGDTLGGVLRTGDVGRVDDAGFFWVTGRRARFAKVYGLRVSLDDVERQARAGAPAAAIAGDEEQIRVFVEGGDAESLRMRLAQAFGLASRTFAVRVLDALPVTAAGKIDYRALADA